MSDSVNTSTHFGSNCVPAPSCKIASAFSSDYYFHIGERGSTGGKGISKRAGVIDSGFRGEWFILFTNLNDVPLYFVKPEAEARLRETLGEKEAVIYPTSKAVCQAMLLPVPKTEIEEISPEALAVTLSEGRKYLAVMLFGLPAFAVTTAYVSILRVTGDNALPMRASVTAIVKTKFRRSRFPAFILPMTLMPLYSVPLGILSSRIPLTI